MPSRQCRRSGPTALLLGLRLPAVGGPLDVPVVQPAGGTTARCTVSSWGLLQDIVCYPVGSAVLADAEFSGMYVGQGRPGKRFGAFHNSLASVSRNSAGGGTSVVSSGGRETVLVSAHALFSAAACTPSAWNTVGNDLIVDVACVNGAGAGTNGDFVVVVIE